MQSVGEIKQRKVYNTRGGLKIRLAVIKRCREVREESQSNKEEHGQKRKE